MLADRGAMSADESKDSLILKQVKTLLIEVFTGQIRWRIGDFQTASVSPTRGTMSGKPCPLRSVRCVVGTERNLEYIWLAFEVWSRGRRVGHTGASALWQVLR